MSLVGTTNEEKIWNYLYDKLGNPYGVAGIMGNMYAESALNPKNLQNTYEKKLGYTDESYTAAVDNGSYTNFVKDSAEILKGGNNRSLKSLSELAFGFTRVCK